MKQITILAVLAISISQYTLASDAKDSENKVAPAKATETVASVQARYLKNILSRNNLSTQEVTAAYSTLGQLVENRYTPSMKELMELCLLYAKHDVSDAPYGFASALKASNPKEFEKALKQLSKEDAEKIKEFAEAGEGSKKGNG